MWVINDMGNSEGAHASPASHSPRHRAKPLKLKSPQVVLPGQKNAPISPGTSTFYDLPDADTDRFYTCKPDIVAGTHSSDIPAYYFTASQLRNAKRKSVSQDADLNRISSDGQKVDVRHIAWSTSNRKSDSNAVNI